MFWNYRIVKIKSLGPDDHYGLYEVYYDDDKDKPWMRTAESTVYGETVAELISTLEMMLKDAKNSPVLNDEDIKDEYEPEC